MTGLTGAEVVYPLYLGPSYYLVRGEACYYCSGVYLCCVTGECAAD